MRLAVSRLGEGRVVSLSRAKSKPNPSLKAQTGDVCSFCFATFIPTPAPPFFSLSPNQLRFAAQQHLINQNHKMLRVAARRLSSLTASPWRPSQATAASSVLSRNLIDSSDDLRSTYLRPDLYLPSRG